MFANIIVTNVEKAREVSEDRMMKITKQEMLENFMKNTMHTWKEVSGEVFYEFINTYPIRLSVRAMRIFSDVPRGYYNVRGYYGLRSFEDVRDSDIWPKNIKARSYPSRCGNFAKYELPKG
jgi:hypothetical protein